jgi:hypothetical protein
MKKIARSMRRRHKLILNYFGAQTLSSSGVVEDLNDKAKVTMRKSYGFRALRALELASVAHLANCPSRKPPTNLSDKPSLFFRRPPLPIFNQVPS